MPTITRAQFERILVRRSKAKLKYARLNYEAVDGTNDDLADAIATAIRSLGLTVADPTDPTDEDLAPVTPQQLPKLLDVGELATLELVLGNRASPDQKADTDNEQDHGKFYDSLEKTVRRKADACLQRYGYGSGDDSGDGESARGSGHAGVLRLDISEDFPWDC